MNDHKTKCRRREEESQRRYNLANSPHTFSIHSLPCLGRGQREVAHEGLLEPINYSSDIITSSPSSHFPFSLLLASCRLWDSRKLRLCHILHVTTFLGAHGGHLEPIMRLVVLGRMLLMNRVYSGHYLIPAVRRLRGC